MPRSQARIAPRAQSAQKKLFVLDTNVLMHDPTSLFQFEEHDVYVPMAILEELDNHKKGVSEVARNARQASRFLEELVADAKEDIADGIPLDSRGNRDATGCLLLQTEAITEELPPSFGSGRTDNQIIAVVTFLQRRHSGRQVILVSKDINMRIKARTLGLAAEDYYNDKVLEDTDLLYTGVQELPADFWEQHGAGMKSWQSGDRSLYRVRGPQVAALQVNQFVYLAAEPGFEARVKELDVGAAVLETLRDHTQPRHNIWGINARNREQNFAFNALMNPDIDFVSLVGQDRRLRRRLLLLGQRRPQLRFLLLDRATHGDGIEVRHHVPRLDLGAAAGQFQDPQLAGVSRGGHVRRPHRPDVPADLDDVDIGAAGDLGRRDLGFRARSAAGASGQHKAQNSGARQRPHHRLIPGLLPAPATAVATPAGSTSTDAVRSGSRASWRPRMATIAVRVRTLSLTALVTARGVT
jgi:hypothetical protein